MSGQGFFWGVEGVKVKVLVAQSCPTLCYPMESMTSSVPWNSPGKNTGVGCHSLLQGIFNPGIEPGLQTDSFLREPLRLNLTWTHGSAHTETAEGVRF